MKIYKKALYDNPENPEQERSQYQWNLENRKEEIRKKEIRKFLLNVQGTLIAYRAFKDGVAVTEGNTPVKRSDILYMLENVQRAIEKI